VARQTPEGMVGGKGKTKGLGKAGSGGAVDPLKFGAEVRNRMWRSEADPKILKRGGGGRQFISSVLIYRKCSQQKICCLQERLFEKIWANRGRPPPPLWIRLWWRLSQTGVKVMSIFNSPKAEVNTIQW